MSTPEPNQGVILWDIDGTLVSSRDSRVDKHVKATEVVLDRDLPSQKRTGGKTDRQILSDLFEANGFSPNPADLHEALRILDILSLEEISEFPIRVNPGVVATLDMVRNYGWINGILTGNTPTRALAKLQSAGIWESFDSNYSYFGDKSPNRFDLVSLSVITIPAGLGFEVIIVGDTPLDIQSAQEHGLQVVAVATGPYATNELCEFNPDLLIPDLESGSASLVELLKPKQA